jgi:hypothetical protein
MSKTKEIQFSYPDPRLNETIHVQECHIKYIMSSIVLDLTSTLQTIE